MLLCKVVYSLWLVFSKKVAPLRGTLFNITSLFIIHNKLIGSFYFTILFSYEQESFLGGNPTKWAEINLWLAERCFK